MAAYILFSYNGLCNGSLIDCLDLFLWCKKHDINVKLGFIENENYAATDAVKLLKNLYADRYDGYISYDYWDSISEHDITIMRLVDVPKVASKIIIFDYVTFEVCHTILKKMNLPLCFVSNYIKHDFDDDIYKFKNIVDSYDNGLFLAEKTYNFLGNENYRQKYLFEGLKQCYRPSKVRRPLIICPGLPEGDFWQNMQNGLWYQHRLNRNAMSTAMYRSSGTYTKNFTNQISEVHYFKSPTVYDRKPRIVLEAFLLGLRVEYHDINKNVSDGATMRFLYGLEKEAKDREYSYNDKLIKWILK